MTTKYRNKNTRVIYKRVWFNETPVATVETFNGSVFNVAKNNIEEAILSQQVDIFTQESGAEQRFKDFHENNPHVYKKLVQMTNDLKSQGHRKIGMQMLFEVIRWRSMMSTNGDAYKMNNDYCSRYSRMIMENEPELDGIFNTRGLKT